MQPPRQSTLFTLSSLSSLSLSLSLSASLTSPAPSPSSSTRKTNLIPSHTTKPSPAMRMLEFSRYQIKQYVRPPSLVTYSFAINDRTSARKGLKKYGCRFPLISNGQIKGCVLFSIFSIYRRHRLDTKGFPGARERILNVHCLSPVSFSHPKCPRLLTALLLNFFQVENMVMEATWRYPNHLDSSLQSKSFNSSDLFLNCSRL